MVLILQKFINSMQEKRKKKGNDLNTGCKFGLGNFKADPHSPKKCDPYTLDFWNWTSLVCTDSPPPIQIFGHSGKGYRMDVVVNKYLFIYLHKYHMEKLILLRVPIWKAATTKLSCFCVNYMHKYIWCIGSDPKIS